MLKNYFYEKDNLYIDIDKLNNGILTRNELHFLIKKFSKNNNCFDVSIHHKTIDTINTSPSATDNLTHSLERVTRLKP